MKSISLTRGKVAHVDDEDYDRINHYNWWAARSGNNWYAMRQERHNGVKKSFYLHREVMQAKKGQIVHHKNGDGLLNVRRNLLLATRSQDGQGFRRKKQTATSVFRGVSWHKHAQRWVVNIRHNGRQKCLGYFANEVVAAGVYKTAAKTCFGNYAAPII